MTFTDAGPAKWYNEWKGVNTKTIVWDDSRDYYQPEHAGSDLPSASLATGMTDIFAYDQAGNLYIYDKTSSPSVSHKIKKFKLQADGSYDTNGEELDVTSYVSGSIFARIDAIAIDLSTKSLYYIDSNNSWPRNYTIKRMRWTDNFGGAVFDSSYSITVSTNQRYISSLAANKDGVFVAVRTTTTAPPFSYITGKLWQIGKDTGSFGEISAGENVKKLYGYDIENIKSETTGDFAPTRFIAVKPKKLVIASTGYKCLQHADNPEYKPKICEFDLETAAMDVFDKVPYILYKDFDASEYCWK